ncbi:putative Multidrug resistance protein mdtG [Magnetospirillum gryphiswaldense MSR-1 v2]|uniref:Multidrug resistance protein mdtG n=1 Tax=Magnetospirillum gryphiswaldense (strain DSM 6361 / JCM 21280 / NBRC 15271 / MSR-1) TaxID=431944 RepID=V6F8X6_MAGGM|nr:MFS transporter [Magnetospirillum gryphiswaldense]CDL01328.1 putative Multidrug resistance protein mdtG [Magnetospirillum gryphiswaldense MSR-1 v2]
MKSNALTGLREGAMRLDSSRSLLIRLLMLAVLVLVPPMVIGSYRALDSFKRGLSPEMDLKAAAIARDLVAQLERAVGFGIPVDKLVGVDEFFAQVLSANPEIRYLGITDAKGDILFLRGALSEQLNDAYRSRSGAVLDDTGLKANIADFVDLALPVHVRDVAVAQVHVGFDQDYVATQLFGIFYDIAVVLVTSLIIAFEVLLFVVVFNVSGPMKLVAEVVAQARRGDFTRVPGITSSDEVGHFVRVFNSAMRQVDGAYRGLMAYIDEVRSGHFDRDVAGQVSEIADRVRFLFRFHPSGAPQVLREKLSSDVRLPLFLFIFAEELSRAFMPLYAQALPSQAGWLTPEVLMALPIAVFMAGIAVGSLWAGAVTERLGSRKVFQFGLAPAVLGCVMSGLAQGVVELSLWRGIAGLGYALVTVACQSYISKTTVDSNRATGLGSYVGAVLTAAVCGTAAGGVLAERIGFAPTFFVSTVLILVSGWLLSHLLSVVDHGAPVVAPVPSGRPLLRIFANWRFTVLVLFAAIPAKMALTGYFFFLVPLTLWSSDHSLAELARIMVLYPLVMLAVSSQSTRLADQIGWRIGQVALGGLIGGAGILSMLAFDGTLPLVIGIVCLGISHGMSASPQLAAIPDICWIECNRHGRTQVLALLRTLERVGSVIGPLLAAGFLLHWGPKGAVIGLGAVVLVMAAIFAMVAGAYGSGPHLETEEDAP